MNSLLSELLDKKNNKKKTNVYKKNKNPFATKYNKIISGTFNVKSFQIKPFSIKKNNIFNFDINDKKNGIVFLENTIQIPEFSIIINKDDSIDNLINLYNKCYDYWMVVNRVYDVLYGFFELVFQKDLTMLEKTATTNFLKRKDKHFLPVIGKNVLDEIIKIKNNLVYIIKHNTLNRKYDEHLDKIIKLTLYNPSDFQLTGTFGKYMKVVNIDQTECEERESTFKHSIDFEELNEHILIYRIKTRDPEVNITDKDIELLQKNGESDEIIQNLKKKQEKIRQIKIKQGILFETNCPTQIQHTKIQYTESTEIKKLNKFINSMGGIDNMINRLTNILNDKPNNGSDKSKKIKLNKYSHCQMRIKYINKKIKNLKS